LKRVSHFAIERKSQRNFLSRHLSVDDDGICSSVL